MIEFRIEMEGRSARLDEIEVPMPIGKKIAPIRERLSEKLSGCVDEGETLQIVFVIDEERRLHVAFRGSPVAVNQARDAMGDEVSISDRMN